MVRCGVVICPIWKELGLEGEFHILVHYKRDENGIEATAAFTRYNNVITDVWDKFRTINLTPDWRDRLLERVG